MKILKDDFVIKKLKHLIGYLGIKTFEIEVNELHSHSKTYLGLYESLLLVKQMQLLSYQRDSRN